MNRRCANSNRSLSRMRSRETPPFQSEARTSCASGVGINTSRESVDLGVNSNSA
jgi:hypothetical protein